MIEQFFFHERFIVQQFRQIKEKLCHGLNNIISQLLYKKFLSIREDSTCHK